ncbi:MULTISPECIES: hypothetical protein [Pseudomonas]|uniref:Uncharacterized protein n=1 Tax=Pseudomonas fragariae (ex Marin et al. 2024) TaxID=3080056 RepID=A0ABU5AYS9_9PSED|nr:MULTISPECIES: hypothetical protein [Pseudomonas]KPB12359.1 Uncharacterized protein AC518_4173 [Pseudomonas syringae pv. syringae]MCH5486285.1 hypothetical protein [Pseudomonas syringae pv. syringae]MCH5496558.1 hypothetical protein [Pseudomonas syringae pv. syringae]MCH5522464.1 hypothetical protein [Pseudomonas syringae pv. syringae]MCH5558191.1 hypothetical protein [Pseudomonas syringae pv. syringae]
MSITKPETLPKPIQRALNQIAHSRSLLYQEACRDQSGRKSTRYWPEA